MTTITLKPNQTNKTNWWRGFNNLLGKELSSWWRTGAWLIHLLVYLVIVNGLTAFDTWDTKQSGGEVAEVFVGFFAFHLMFVMAGVVLSTQGSIIGERQDGTAAWLLSKPLSRSAFLLAKLTALGGSFLIVGVLIPVLAAFGTWHYYGFPPNWSTLPLVVLGLFLSVLFFLSFGLLVGTILDSRKGVAAVGLLMLFGQLQFGDRAIGVYLPGGMVYRLTEVVAGAAQSTALLACAVTAVFTVAFIAIALHRIQRVEF